MSSDLCRTSWSSFVRPARAAANYYSTADAQPQFRTIWNQSSGSGVFLRLTKEGIMSLPEGFKKTVEKATGWQRRAEAQLEALPRPRKVSAFPFKDDGVTPNHPRWPLLVVWRAVRLPPSLNPAAVIGWKGSWRDGVYHHLHHHSRIHEAMGIARGTARIGFSGERGRALKLSTGDLTRWNRPSVHRRQQKFSRGRSLSAERDLRRMHSEHAQT